MFLPWILFSLNLQFRQITHPISLTMEPAAIMGIWPSSASRKIQLWVSVVILCLSVCLKTEMLRFYFCTVFVGTVMASSPSWDPLGSWCYFIDSSWLSFGNSLIWRFSFILSPQQCFWVRLDWNSHQKFPGWNEDITSWSYSNTLTSTPHWVANSFQNS